MPKLSETKLVFPTESIRRYLGYGERSISLFLQVDVARKLIRPKAVCEIYARDEKDHERRTPAEFQETGAPPQGQGDYGGDQAPPEPPPTGCCGG